MHAKQERETKPSAERSTANARTSSAWCKIKNFQNLFQNILCLLLSYTNSLYRSAIRMASTSSAGAPEGRIANVDATLTTVIGQLESEANVKKVRPVYLFCHRYDLDSALLLWYPGLFNTFNLHGRPFVNPLNRLKSSPGPL